MIKSIDEPIVLISATEAAESARADSAALARLDLMISPVTGSNLPIQVRLLSDRFFSLFQKEMHS